MLTLREFKLPEHLVGAEMKHIAPDPLLVFEFNGRREGTHAAVGRLGDGAGRYSGVVVHGTADCADAEESWREEHVYLAPTAPAMEVVSTEFHHVEFLENLNRRLVGCYETADKPGVRRGFVYEGPFDGSGDWYPVDIPAAKQTVVKGCHQGILICARPGNNDELHVLSLEDQTWQTHHVGLAREWSIDGIVKMGPQYSIRGVHDNGVEFHVFHPVK